MKLRSLLRTNPRVRVLLKHHRVAVTAEYVRVSLKSWAQKSTNAEEKRLSKKEKNIYEKKKKKRWKIVVVRIFVFVDLTAARGNVSLKHSNSVLSVAFDIIRLATHMFQNKKTVIGPMIDDKNYKKDRFLLKLLQRQSFVSHINHCIN